MTVTGIYIHWPFCAAKCPYCDFNSHVAARIDHGLWQEVYLRAIAHYAEMLPDRHISTIFFGGGTPSLMKPEVVRSMLDRIASFWDLAEDIEITLEANPTSVEAAKLQAFKDVGINRLSMGIQSLRPEALKFLGREHSSEEALEALKTAQSVFDRVSFDLIYARPQQTVDAWAEELHEALTHARDHLSLYQLTIERGTPFYDFEKEGRFIMPEENLAADFYLLTHSMMTEAGLPAYEVSNYARRGQESRHNLIYWRYQDYIGIGPGAHGHITMNDGIKYATRDHKTPGKWLDKVRQQGHGAHPFQALPPHDQFSEGLMMGLRLYEGLDLTHLSKQTGWSWEQTIPYQKLKTLEEGGAITLNDTRITPTLEGVLRLNSMVEYLL